MSLQLINIRRGYSRGCQFTRFVTFTPSQIIHGANSLILILNSSRWLTTDRRKATFSRLSVAQRSDTSPLSPYNNINYYLNTLTKGKAYYKINTQTDAIFLHFGFFHLQITMPQTSRRKRVIEMLNRQVQRRKSLLAMMMLLDEWTQLLTWIENQFDFTWESLNFIAAKDWVHMHPAFAAKVIS